MNGAHMLLLQRCVWKQKCILENSRISDAIPVFWEIQSSSLQVRVTQTAKINYFLKTLQSSAFSL